MLKIRNYSLPFHRLVTGFMVTIFNVNNIIMRDLTVQEYKNV